MYDWVAGSVGLTLLAYVALAEGAFAIVVGYSWQRFKRTPAATPADVTLSRDEHAVWTGTPKREEDVLRRFLGYVIANLILCVPVTVVAFFVDLTHVIDIVLWVGVGATVTAARMFQDVTLRKRSVYIVTRERVMVVVGADVQALSIDGCRAPQLSDHGDGTWDIDWNAPKKGAYRRTPPLIFENVADAPQLLEKLGITPVTPPALAPRKLPDVITTADGKKIPVRRSVALRLADLTRRGGNDNFALIGSGIFMLFGLGLSIGLFPAVWNYYMRGDAFPYGSVQGALVVSLGFLLCGGLVFVFSVRARLAYLRQVRSAEASQPQ